MIEGSLRCGRFRELYTYQRWLPRAPKIAVQRGHRQRLEGQQVLLEDEVLDFLVEEAVLSDLGGYWPSCLITFVASRHHLGAEMQFSVRTGLVIRVSITWPPRVTPLPSRIHLHYGIVFLLSTPQLVLPAEVCLDINNGFRKQGISRPQPLSLAKVLPTIPRAEPPKEDNKLNLNVL
jgi:hypothetical protein